MPQSYLEDSAAKTFRFARVVLIILSIPVLFISITPIVYALIWALFGTSTAGILGGFTPNWLLAFLSDWSWLRSLGFSTIICVVASTIALFLVTVTSYSARIIVSTRDRVTTGLILLALLFPQVIYGIALRYFLAVTHIPAALGLLFANIVLILPVQYLVIETGRANVTDSQLHAATVLGASPIAGIIRVYCPLMWASLVTAWLIGSLMVFDELVIAMFIWDNPIEPISERLWGLFGRSSEPIPGVVTLLVICFVVVFVSLIIGVRFIKRMISRKQ